MPDVLARMRRGGRRHGRRRHRCALLGRRVGVDVSGEPAMIEAADAVSMEARAQTLWVEREAA